MKNLFYALIVISGIGCNIAPKEAKSKIIQSESSVSVEGLKLLQQNCYACHSITSTSHDAIIAPPMVAVKRRYLMAYSSKEAFVKAITEWTLNPTEENSLMKGAVQNFKVMPKQPFNKEDIIKIATYIFENELEKPTWFQKHFEDQHPNGMGQGQGNGKMNGQGKGRS
jgi:hypothetical protein